ncbi:MAG: hypothetical protein MHM6MM_006039 [Cercozoa sp. M6MM]
MFTNFAASSPNRTPASPGDVYSGYDAEAAPSLAAADAPSTQMRLPTGARLGTAALAGGFGVRPMTSDAGAGFSAARGALQGSSRSGKERHPTAPLEAREALTSAAKARMAESGIHRLLEASAVARLRRDFATSLEKAKTAAKRERALSAYREKHGDATKVEITVAVFFNLASAFEKCGRWEEALQTYAVLLRRGKRGSSLPHAGRLRVNMGNCHFHLGHYAKAAKLYRMAMDELARFSPRLKARILGNLAACAIRMRRFADAIAALEELMSVRPEPRAAMNLLMLYMALGDDGKIRRGFQRLVRCEMMRDPLDPGQKGDVIGDDIEENDTSTGQETRRQRVSRAKARLLAHRADELANLCSRTNERVKKAIIQAAQVIAPALVHQNDEDVLKGDQAQGAEGETLQAAKSMDWAIRQVLARAGASSRVDLDAPLVEFEPDLEQPHFVDEENEDELNGFETRGIGGVFGGCNVDELASVARELQMSKGVMLLEGKEIDAAIDVFSSLETGKTTGSNEVKGDNANTQSGNVDLEGRAAVNLSFMYLMENELDQAEKYAQQAVHADRYSALALVNRGNCHVLRGELEEAKDTFLEAIGIRADCVAAIYNLGLVCRRLGRPDEALQAFRKLYRVLPENEQVLSQLAALFESEDNPEQAEEWLKLLAARTDSRDSQVCVRLSELPHLSEDQAAAHLADAHRALPSNPDVAARLAVWHARKGALREAAIYFRDAADTASDPTSTDALKWRLLAAGCLRRLRRLEEACDEYRRVIRIDPDNEEALSYLSRLATQLNHEDATVIRQKLASLQQKTSQPLHAGRLHGQQVATSIDTGVFGSKAERHADETEELGQVFEQAAEPAELNNRDTSRSERPRTAFNADVFNDESDNVEALLPDDEDESENVLAL